MGRVYQVPEILASGQDVYVLCRARDYVNTFAIGPQITRSCKGLGSRAHR
jgi:hypothetical protein